MRNGTGDPWVPKPDAAPIDDPQVQSDGKYLCLVLNDADWVYIKSTNLIDLTDYYTKVQVDDKIDILDSSVSGALDAIKEYVDAENNEINQHIDASISNIADGLTSLINTVEEQFTKIDTSLDSLTDDLAGVHEILDNTNASIE